MNERPVFIATRGSALALAQSRMVLAQCRALFPDEQFEVKIIKTTGDKLQTTNLAAVNNSLPRGLFTKELESAMLQGEADFAVHSLKDLPTELPEGLTLAGVSQREDARDVLIYRSSAHATGPSRGMPPLASMRQFPSGAIVATGSTRRQAQLLAARSDLRTVPIRGNVGTRIRKLWEQPEIDALVLALAGLKRLGYEITPEGELVGDDVPPGTLATILPLDLMLPCVGQAALGYECPAQNARGLQVCSALNDSAAFQCVTAERAFLRAMGGGCLSPVAACAELLDGQLRLRAVSFEGATPRRFDQTGSPADPVQLGEAAARALKSS